VHGSITVRTPDGRYLWYTVEIRASPPPAERTIEVEAAVRTAAQLEIEVSNPLDTEVEFEVELEGEGLLGESRLIVAPKEAGKYLLVFAPLVAGVASGAVSFLNPSVGEFWYKLLLKGTQPVPEELPLLECELGKSAEHLVTVENPLGDPIALRAQVSNARNWLVGTKGGGPLTVAPYGSLTVVLQYTPSLLGTEQPASVSLVHARMADWMYTVRGIGLRPTTMPVTEVAAELGSITSGSFNFVNPFDMPVQVSMRLDSRGSAPGVFALLMKRVDGVSVAPRAKLQVSFTFSAEDMHEHSAAVVLAIDQSEDNLVWTYPIVGFAESRPAIKPFVLAIRARQQLQTLMDLPLDGLDGSGELTGQFAVEVTDIPEEHETLLRASLRFELAGPLSEERVLPVAVQWMPLKPLKAHVGLVVRQASGGRWKYELMLQASAPEVDDVIMMESTLNKTSSVSFALANAFAAEAEFTATFSAESPTVFSVRPSSGTLPRVGSPGQQFIIDFTPYEYGKVSVGVLVIATAEMQWTYEVRGQPPAFVLPEVKKKVDDQIGPEIERKLELNKHLSTQRNFMKRNMQL